MKIKNVIFIILSAALFSGCSHREAVDEDARQPYVTGYVYPGDSVVPEGEKTGRIPVNYKNQTGLWLPYMDFGSYMYGRTEDEYREAITEKLTEAKEQGINTIYFHVHPNGDAYYDSELFPKGVYYDGDYDPLEIMTETAHSMGISVHGWINPLRLQTAEQMNSVHDGFIIKKWVDEGSPYVCLVGDRWYLVPVYDEVRELVNSAAAEILEKYDVDGIHIDDYFYPTEDADFDSEAFEKSGASDLARWRRENVSLMIKGIYDTVKSHGRLLRFGISPQGNIETDMNRLYADVKRWCSEEGYADYIVPQIYYGLKNETCPFEPTLRRWEEMCSGSGISLVVGLAAYKQGQPDKWAGEAGENEWIEDPGLLAKEIKMVDESSADGKAFYS